MHLRYLILFILALSTCQGDRFEPFSLVNKLRILAVKSSAPELRPNEEATLSALVSVGEGQEATYKWEWCPFTTNARDKFACPLTKEELLELVAQGLPEGVPISAIPLEDFDLGNEPVAKLRYPAPKELLRGICEQLQKQTQDASEDLAISIPTYNCDDGYEVSIRLTVTADGKDYVAAKRINLWLASSQDADVNPVVQEIQIRPKSEDDKKILLDAGHDWVSSISDFAKDWYVLPADEKTPVMVGVAYDIQSIVKNDTIQIYARRAPEGSDKEFLEVSPEVLQFQWLTTFGSLFPSSNIFRSGSSDMEKVRKTSLFFPSEDLSQREEVSDGDAFIADCPELKNDNPKDGCDIGIWSVVRDDRLGVDWQQRVLIATGVKP